MKQVLLRDEFVSSTHTTYSGTSGGSITRLYIWPPFTFKEDTDRLEAYLAEGMKRIEGEEECLGIGKKANVFCPTVRNLGLISAQIAGLPGFIREELGYDCQFYDQPSTTGN
jgi:hypothetical protein